MNRVHAPAPQLVDTEAAAVYAQVEPGTIRVWHHRGWLTRYGRPGRAQWDLREIQRLLDRRSDDAR